MIKHLYPFHLKILVFRYLFLRLRNLKKLAIELSINRFFKLRRHNNQVTKQQISSCGMGIKNSIISLLIITSTIIHADTIDHYMNIVNNVPQMEMKADPESQAWARSARNILILTSESIGESLMLANETAARQGAPLFCLPPGVRLHGVMLNELIQQTYKEISSQQSDKNSMTVSQVALIGVAKLYPCIKSPH